MKNNHNQMMFPFKINWERKTKQIELPKHLIQKMLESALQKEKLQSYQIINDGCANINIKVNLDKGNKKLLRVYLRDVDAVYREQSIAYLIKHKIPVPQIEYIGTVNNYRFAISEFKSGITLSALLLSNQTYDLADIMYQVGMLLAELLNFNFSHSGFFDNKLKVATIVPSNEYIQFAKRCLQKQNVSSIIPEEIVKAIYLNLDKYACLIEAMTSTHLVHGDFGPENILVDNVNNTWRVSAILDWEFVFSGSMLCDIANMLRYSHRMPKEFKASFVDGLRDNGVILPDHWEVTIQVLNIISLLDCLDRNDINKSPLKCADIKDLLQYIVSSLDKILENSCGNFSGVGGK